MVDATVAAAILFQEPEAETARDLLAGNTIHAPRLLIFELANIAVKKVRRHKKSRMEIMAALSAIPNLEVRLHEIDPGHSAQLALESELSAYDAAYLWLSRSLSAPLLTFDEKLRKAALRR